MSAPFYPQGRYLCRVTNQGIGEAKTGTPQVVIRFEVLQTESGELVQQVYERTAYLYLTEKSAPRTVDCLKALGYTRDSFKFLDKTQTNHHDLANQEFIGFCSHEKDQSGEQLREKWGIALDNEFEVAPLDSKKIRELDQLFGKSLKAAAPAPRAAKAAGAAVAEMPPHGASTDDDVPF